MTDTNQTSFSFIAPATAAAKTNTSANCDQVLAAYSLFVDETVTSYLREYKQYRQGGGQDNFFKRCWWLMMNETVEEAQRILQQYRRDDANAEKLSRDLQKIAEDRLLQVNDSASV